MTPLQFANLNRLRTTSDTTLFPDSQMLLYTNVFLYEFARLINDTNEDLYGSISFADLVQNQREYTLPTDMLNKMKSLEFKPTAASDWVRLKEFNIENIKKPTSETDIRNYFGNEPGRAFYDIYRNSVFLFTGELSENVTDGLKLYSFSKPQPLTDLTDDTNDMSIDPSNVAHGLPEVFHELLSRRISIEWKSNRTQPIPLTEHEQKFEYDFGMALESIKGKNQDRVFAMRVPLVHDQGVPAGDNTTNYGYDL